MGLFSRRGAPQPAAGPGGSGSVRVLEVDDSKTTSPPSSAPVYMIQFIQGQLKATEAVEAAALFEVTSPRPPGTRRFLLRIHMAPGHEGEMQAVAAGIVKAERGSLRGSTRESILLDLIEEPAPLPATLADGARNPSLIFRR